MSTNRANYVVPVPTRHRTDWGEAFAEALEGRLQELQPQNLDRERTGTFSASGGRLVVRVVNATTGDMIEVRIWEDEADVRWRDSLTEFTLPTQPYPPSWIPDAVAFVEQLMSDNGFF